MSCYYSVLVITVVVINGLHCMETFGHADHVARHRPLNATEMNQHVHTITCLILTSWCLLFVM